MGACDGEAPGERLGAKRSAGTGFPAKVAEGVDDIAQAEAVERAFDREKAGARAIPSLPLHEHSPCALGGA
jgi:hypothetical protein